jgi:hypothetical protein
LIAATLDVRHNTADKGFDTVPSLVILSTKAGEICRTLAALYVANESMWLLMQTKYAKTGEYESYREN